MLSKHKSFMYFSGVLADRVNFEYFIANKLLKNEIEGKKVSRPIVRLSIISISLAMLVNIITIAVVTGFQKEIREKVIGFGSHAVVTRSGEQSVFESSPILKDQFFYPSFTKYNQVRQIHAVAYKPGLMQSDSRNGKQQEIQGVMMKGVGGDYDFTFFKANLKEGRIPVYSGDTVSDEILISARIASDLHYKTGDKAVIYFVKNKPVKKVFRIAGIFETGLEDFDKEMIVGDLRQVQKLNDWGIQTSAVIEDTLAENGHLIVRAEATGGNGNYWFDWGKGWENYRGFVFFPSKDTVIRLITSDYMRFIDGKQEETTVPDTAYLKITISGDKKSLENYDLNPDKTLKKEYLDDNGYKYRITAGKKIITIEQVEGAGSSGKYVGAFEFTLRDWNHLEEDVRFLKKKIQFRSGSDEQLHLSSIVDNENDIFVWLGFLDINVWIILVLMVLIGIINMGSALLVMILVKTNFIGIMKALGASDWSIRKVFLYQAGFLILRAMLWGNLLGIGICVLQHYFEIIKLNPEVYYLSAVPVDLSIVAWILLNVATLIVCIIALIVPSYVITRISPVKAIRFN